MHLKIAPQTHTNSSHGSAGEIFSELMSSLEQLEEKYYVLYVSDPSRSVQYPSVRELERFLAESASGNTSANGTCDGVCQIKSSLWERTPSRKLLFFVVSLVLVDSALFLLTVKPSECFHPSSTSRTLQRVPYISIQPLMTAI